MIYMHTVIIEKKKNIFHLWLVMFQDGDNGVSEPCRQQQMCVLRQLCIPRVALLLHTVLHSTEQHQRALQLADVLAAQQYGLYKV